jgi:hypothetical protein
VRFLVFVKQKRSSSSEMMTMQTSSESLSSFVAVSQREEKIRRDLLQKEVHV